MTDIGQTLQRDGWCLKESFIKQVLNAENRNAGSLSVINLALNCDLNEIGEKYLQEKLSSGKEDSLDGPCVLQIVKIRNISAPKENEESSFAPRMLKLCLTDGHFTCFAIEIGRIEQMSLRSAPGTKVRLCGSIPVKGGVLQLRQPLVKVLGGKVEKLYTKWKVSKEAAGYSRSGIVTDGAPPPFLPFGKQLPKVSPSSKPVDKLPGKVAKNETEDADEFNQQRKAAIAEVAKDGGGKRFDSNVKPILDQDIGKKFSRNQHDRSNAPKAQQPSSQQRAAPNQSRLYRELLTDGGLKVDQNLVRQFEEMSFAHDDVVACLQQSNNDFDGAMDMLVEVGKKSTVRNDDGRHQRDQDSRRGRRGGRRGGRKGHFHELEDKETPNSTSATLFDFLKEKISDGPGSQVPPSAQINRERQFRENWQSEYRSNQEGNDAYKTYNERNETNYVKRGDQNRHNRGRRGGGFHDGKRNSGRQNYEDGNYRSENRTNYHPSSHFDENRSRSEYKSREENYRQRNRNTDNNQRKYTNKENSSFRRNEASTRKNQPNKYQEVNSHTFFHRQHDASVATISKQHSDDFSHDIPPFPNFIENPPPRKSAPTTFGSEPAPESLKSFVNKDRSHKPLTGVTQAPSLPSGKPSNQDQHVQVTVPKWSKGSHCMAKYWEDSCFYPAVVIDLHKTAPTAVVEFLEYGNYEEVELFNLRPLFTSACVTGTSNPSDQPSNNQNSMSAQRHHKRPIALYVPPAFRQTDNRQ